jgi:hypothetical protein
VEWRNSVLGRLIQTARHRLLLKLIAVSHATKFYEVIKCTVRPRIGILLRYVRKHKINYSQEHNALNSGFIFEVGIKGFSLYLYY